MSFLSRHILKRFSILDRYLIQQFSGPFILGVAGFSIIAIVEILMYLVDLTISRGVSMFVTFRLLIYKFPSIMVIFFPMAVLFAIMLLLVRMAKDNELTVLRTSGVRTIRILTPLLILLFVTSVFAYIINEKIVPWTNRVSDNLIRLEVTKRPPIEIAKDVFFKVPGDRFFYIKEIDPNQSRMKDILIFEKTQHFPRIISAKSAHWDNTNWTLFEGQQFEVDAEGSISFYNRFDTFKIHVDQALHSFYKKHRTASQMDSKELKTKIGELEDGGMNTQRLRVEYYMKQSTPFGSFIFGIIGIAYVLTFVRSGKDWWGVIAAIIAAVLSVGFYIFLLAVFKSLGKSGVISAFWAAWIPNIFYGIVGLMSIGKQIKSQ